jgi:hypothetical protein
MAMSWTRFSSDPFSFIIALFMTGVLLLWFSSGNTTINPIATNTTITNNIAQAYGTCSTGIGGTCGVGQVAGIKWLFSMGLFLGFVSIAAKMLEIKGEEGDGEE